MGAKRNEPDAVERRFPVADAGRDPLTGKVIPHERSEKTAVQVETMAALGFTEKDIAVALNLRPGQVKQHYATELEAAAVKANMQVARAFFDVAKSGKNWQASLAWLKARAGWEDGGSLSGGGISITINL